MLNGGRRHNGSGSVSPDHLPISLTDRSSASLVPFAEPHPFRSAANYHLSAAQVAKRSSRFLELEAPPLHQIHQIQCLSNPGRRLTIAPAIGRIPALPLESPLHLSPRLRLPPISPATLRSAGGAGFGHIDTSQRGAAQTFRSSTHVGAVRWLGCDGMAPRRTATANHLWRRPAMERGRRLAQSGRDGCKTQEEQVQHGRI